MGGQFRAGAVRSGIKKTAAHLVRDAPRLVALVSCYLVLSPFRAARTRATFARSLGSVKFFSRSSNAATGAAAKAFIIAFCNSF
nr:MAG TPA: hypothetical protein [Caudoviricetes sp.]